ncbi:N-6 DNA methylase [Maricaulaceae bacterium MS644]
MTNDNLEIRDEIIELSYVAKAIERGIIELSKNRITYKLARKQSYLWTDPEEWVRARTISYLIIECGYPPNRIRTEVQVPRRTPSDIADIVVYRDDLKRDPYLVCENKASGLSSKERTQAIEQTFGNANSLRAPFALYDDFDESILFDVANFPAMERESNRIGAIESVPPLYGEAPEFAILAGGDRDISPAKATFIETKIRRAHSIIWSGGKRDPLTAFDEWSKLLFAKVADERGTPTGSPRKFQIGTKETTAAVATRVHALFSDACRADPTIFPDGIKINLPDKKIFDIVHSLQLISFTGTDVDHIGVAFESFFGSVFRGELGQYFTMRQLARFSVAMLEISSNDYVLDPTAGSGGFLLEVLLQVWHQIDRDYSGQSSEHISRIKNDFALQKVFGIEIHEILARICKINLLLHHDGHTNIEGDRSCLDSTFAKPRLNPNVGRFQKIVGNPPFGDEVPEGDEDHLGTNTLRNFELAENRDAIASEHAIVERSIAFLEPGGELAFILPDGFFNNQGEMSNCPRARRFLARNGFIDAIVSLPDHAFRKSGAQNKTSILFFRKFDSASKRKFDQTFRKEIIADGDEVGAIAKAWQKFDHYTFLAEANHIGYNSTGASAKENDLYIGSEGGNLSEDQSGTILGAYKKFKTNRENYSGSNDPDTMSVKFSELWASHKSNRLDPKYFLFKREEMTEAPEGWITLPISSVMRRREELVDPSQNPTEAVVVMTLGQDGEIRAREAGKGKSPPEWIGMYFEDSPSQWYRAKENDVVFSSIDLWKGCISVTPEEFNGALVTKEFPIYAVTDNRLSPQFLSYLLRSHYYQRAFRAITTGHSNRRRTQQEDFEALEISFPETLEAQNELIADIIQARREAKQARDSLLDRVAEFSRKIDGKAPEGQTGSDSD